MIGRTKNNYSCHKNMSQLQRVHTSLMKQQSWIQDMVMRSNSILGPDMNQSKTGLIQEKVLITFISEVLFHILQDKMEKGDELGHHKSIKKFVKRVFAEVSCNPVCNVVSVAYFKRFLENFEYEIDMDTWKYYFGICVVLGCKMWEDRVYTNGTYLVDMSFEKDGLSLRKFNQLEKTALKVLGYNLFVSFQDFRDFINHYSEILSTSIKTDLHAEQFRDSFRFAMNEEYE